MYIDYDALLAEHKALLIISILLICMINLVLIARQLRKSLFYQSPKLMTVISLAIGDILLALFPLAIEARFYFDPTTFYRRCGVIISYVTYQNFLIHFVYGLGLIVLMIEAAYRHTLSSQGSSFLRAVFTSSLPWIVGLVVVLPLCMSRVDYMSRCANKQSLEAMVAVSVFLPAFLAVVVAAVVNCSRIAATPLFQAQELSQLPVTYNHQDTLLPIAYAQEVAPSPNLHSNQHVVHYPTIQPAGPHINAPVNAELKKLAVIAALFFIMVIPQGSLSLIIKNIKVYSTYATTILSETFYWLMVARSYITPVIMMSYADL